MPTSSSSSCIQTSSHFTRRSKSTQQQASAETGHMKSSASNGYVARKKEKVVRYRECRKNHAANIGGYIVDGWRKFMASSEEGMSAALRCAACSYHRSFHKREVESDVAVCDCSSNSNNSSSRRN